MRKNANVCIFAITIVGSISFGIVTNYCSNMVIPFLPHIISLPDSEESSHTNTFGRSDDEGIIATYVSHYNRVLDYHTVVINASTSTSTSEVTLTWKDEKGKTHARVMHHCSEGEWCCCFSTQAKGTVAVDIVAHGITDELTVSTLDVVCG